MKPMSWSAFALLPLILPPGTAAPLAGTAFQEAAPKPADPKDAALEAEFEALVEAFDKAQAEFYERIGPLYKALDKEGISQDEAEQAQAEIQKAWADEPMGKFRPQFEALAVKAAKRPVAVRAWSKGLELAQGPTGEDFIKRAVTTLLADHLDSPELAALGHLVYEDSLGPERYLEVMNTLREKSPHEGVKAAATLGLARTIVRRDVERGKAYYRELIERWNKLEAAWGGAYGDIAERAIFELERLQIGMVAPDFESVDETGAKFKVSDYRGKVVVLDFWGYW